LANALGAQHQGHQILKNHHPEGSSLVIPW
jgi:hypothetical protein